MPRITGSELATHTFMIFYDEASRAAVPAGFEALDNSCPRDRHLFEIEPVLDYLESHPVNDGDFYGFFSPRLFDKTGLSATQVLALATRLHANRDIHSLSPYPGHLARFINPVKQGEHCHPGLEVRFLAMSEHLPEALATDARAYARSRIPNRYALMSHYFWASGRFWKDWAAVVRPLLAQASREPGLRALLDEDCPYAGGRNPPYQFKTFLLERLAGLLAWQQRSRVALPGRRRIWQHGYKLLPDDSLTQRQAMWRLARAWLAQWLGPRPASATTGQPAR